MLRILVCDEVPIVRDGLRALLASEPDLDVVETTESGVDAIMLVRSARPDVVVTGLRLSGLPGLEMIRRLGQEQLDPRPRFVVFTGSDSDTVVDCALHAGVHGLLLREATREELTSAVRAAAHGQVLLAPQIARRLIERLSSGYARSATELRPVLRQLTEREHQVLLLIGRGMSVPEIAGELTIGEATVRTHLYRLRCKLMLRDRAQLVSFAHRAGLLQPALFSGRVITVITKASHNAYGGSAKDGHAVHHGADVQSRPGT
jgi:DNA-binding NarL/FixJ family response regulator